MKTLIAIGLATILMAAPPSFSVEGESEPASPGRDLALLKAEYEKRRADALRPVLAWYRSRLEALGNAVEKEKRLAAEAFWIEDQPELKQALCTPGWVWRSEANSEGVELAFGEDGTVHHVGLQGTWRISGPCEVTVQPNDDSAYILRFDSSLKGFTGDRRGVTGERQPDRGR